MITGAHVVHSCLCSTLLAVSDVRMLPVFASSKNKHPVTAGYTSSVVYCPRLDAGLSYRGGAVSHAHDHTHLWVWLKLSLESSDYFLEQKGHQNQQNLIELKN